MENMKKASGDGGWFGEGRSEDALPLVGTLGPGARCCNLPCLALPRTMSTILPDNKHIIAYSPMDVYVLRNITDLIYL